MTDQVRVLSLRKPQDEGGISAADITDDGLALALGERWIDARYVAAWGKWFFWNGRTWHADDTLEHMSRTRGFLRNLADEADEKLGERLLKASTVATVVALARSNEAQATRVDIWDSSPWLLGTPGGTVDLSTGELREADPEDYITKSTAVAPAPVGTPCPLWTRFLQEITDGDKALQAYLNRFFGYALTGSIKEHTFVFGHGTGANGKGVTVNTVMRILGDYALTIPTEMLMVSQTDRHPTELARLRGVRLAIGSETEEGKRWAEAKIKVLTGGDKIAARFMRQDFFEFEPEFKLFVVGNHKPSLSGIDEAMRRRLHLVPFGVTIPKKDRDLELEQKLESEGPAILRWMIDGCLRWQEQGLEPPELIRAATDEYLSAEDAISLWIEEACERDPQAWEASGKLYNSWRSWANRAGEYAGSKKWLSQTLKDRGFERGRSGGKGARGFIGLRVLDTGKGD